MKKGNEFSRLNYMEEQFAKADYALTNRNALNYYEACEYAGLEPKDQLLYEHGLMDKIYTKRWH